jgi:hypothetical protein
MNSTELHTLLVAPPMSRATFFAQLVVEPTPQNETACDDPLADSATAPPTPLATAAQPAATGFAA